MNRPSFIEELEQISFVGLIPLYSIGRPRTEVQALDVWTIELLLYPNGVLGDRRDDER